jgi:hypothetical protein
VGQTTSEVVDLHVAPGGAVALALADGTLARFDPRDGRLLVLATTVGHLDQSGTAFAANGTLAAVPTTGGLIAIDLGEGTTWTVVPEVDLDAYAVAPDGASVVIAVDDKLLRFRTDRPALAPATLRALTNAHLEPTGDALTWSGTP